jgi:hypothetical protein
MLAPPFAGDGQRDDTGAAEVAAAAAVAAGTATEGTGVAIFPAQPQANLLNIRTRQNLADLINSAADQLQIKQEAGDAETMDTEEGSEVEFMCEVDGDQHSVYYEGEGDEDDENLLDEQDQEDEDGNDTDDEAESGAEREGGERDVPALPAQVSLDKAADPADQEEGEREEPEEGNKGEELSNSGESDEDSDRAEIIDPINPNLRPDPRFFAVRSMLAGSMEPRLLNKRMKRPEQDTGFLVEGDERWYRNANSSCTSKMMNSSASFLPNGRCHTCLSGEHDAWIGSNGQPVVFIASDQHFPANLPADGEGECIRILRIENGSLAEIAKELASRSPRAGILPGTVIMLGAPQQLAVVSVEFYAQEWKNARNYLKEVLGDIIVLPLIPLTATGFKDSRIIRGLIDLSAWLEDMEEHELRLLRNTRKSFEDVYLSKTERGAGWADAPLNMALPVSLCSKSHGTTAYTSGSWGARPTAIQPLTEAGEKYWVEKLVLEINRELRTGLASEICYNRTISAVKRQADNVGAMSMLTVGASNSARTAAALRKKGITVVEMGGRGWKVSDESVDALLEQLQIVASKDDILVLQCLDSRVFMEVDSTGGVQCPKRDKDGIVHVLGRIIVAKDLLLEILLDQLDPVFKSRKDSLIILVCPLTRFLTSCCDAHEGKGGGEEDAKRLLRELGSLRREIKSRLIKRGYDNVRMVDPLDVNGAASSVPAARSLMKDQVHMHRVGYARLAEGIKELAHSWLLGKKRKSTGSDRPDAKRIRLDSTVDKRGKGGGSSRGKGGREGRGGGGSGKFSRGRGKDNGKF